MKGVRRMKALADMLAAMGAADYAAIAPVAEMLLALGYRPYHRGNGLAFCRGGQGGRIAQLDMLAAGVCLRVRGGDGVLRGVEACHPGAMEAALRMIETRDRMERQAG